MKQRIFANADLELENICRILHHHRCWLLLQPWLATKSLNSSSITSILPFLYQIQYDISRHFFAYFLPRHPIWYPDGQNPPETKRLAFSWNSSPFSSSDRDIIYFYFQWILLCRIDHEDDIWAVYWAGYYFTIIDNRKSDLEKESRFHSQSMLFVAIILRSI